jgi:CRP-like cAMP-binding protein
MQVPQATADLAYRLRGLGKAGAVLHLGAHPDDEDSGTLAYLSRRHGVRTVYWSATRGEGGQNRLGPESGEALGILRTWETLAARALDGAEALYGPFSATLRARGDATVLVMRGADFRERLRRHPDLSEQVLRYLARQLALLG